MLEVLQSAILVFELPQVPLMIPPARQNMLRNPFSIHLAQVAYRIIQQVNIGRKMQVLVFLMEIKVPFLVFHAA